MPSIVAKTMFVVSAAMLVGVLALLYLTSRPPAGAQQVVAQFQNAFPLIEGMHVRVDGAIAGSVGEIEVNDEGLAEVSLVLDDAIEPAKADATAAIRQQDTTGDSYVAFEPGTAKEPLEEVDGEATIVCNAESPEAPCKNTLVAPRFDDLLNAFGPAERAGIKLMLVELSRAVDERGDDLNQAALKLRPALVAANQALAEVNQQNDALRSVIADAEAVTGQAASRREQLAGLIDSLETTLEVTASESEALDAGLERLPETVGRARTTLAALTRAAGAARPLAEQIRTGAPQLATALGKAPGFLDDVDAFLGRTRPTLDLTRKLLRAGTPTIKADPQRVVTGAFDLAPALSNLLTGVLGDDNTIKALFGDDSGGVPGAGTLEGFGLGAIAVEPGNQAGYPPEHADRHFLRISAVLNCEVFGVPVGPGCLTDAVTAARQASAAESEPSGKPQRRDSAAAVDESSRPSEPDLGRGLPDLKLEDLLSPDDFLSPDALSKSLEDGLKRGLNGDRNAPKRLERRQHPSKANDRALTDLLDFLLR